LKQIAGLPLTIQPDGTMSVWLITSRGSGRWIIPKGNPIRGLLNHQVAEREVLEEAGLVGRSSADILGEFIFQKSSIKCHISVYPVWVERELKIWPEQGQRQVLRCELEQAISLAASPGLSQILKNMQQASYQPSKQTVDQVARAFR